MKKLSFGLALVLLCNAALAGPYFWYPGRYQIHSNEARAQLTAYDANGIYTMPPQDIPQFGQLASSSQIAAAFQDIATALTYVYSISSSPNLNASLLNSGTVNCARMPGLTGAITTSPGSCTTALASSSVVLSGPIVSGILPDVNLTANVVKYNDTGTNFTGVTAPTIAGAAIATGSIGTWVATVVGCTTAPTVTVQWVRVGNLVNLTIPAVTCTSGGATPTLLQMTGSPPAAIIPISTGWSAIGTALQSGAATGLGAAATLNNSGTIVFAYGNSAGSWAGVKGISSPVTFTYQIAQ